MEMVFDLDKLKNVFADEMTCTVVYYLFHYHRVYFIICIKETAKGYLRHT